MLKKKEKPPVEKVVLKDYPKVIFFFPLFFYSLIALMIQMITGAVSDLLGEIWFAILFINLFVIAFDFDSTKFFILVMSCVLLILIVIFYGFFPYIEKLNEESVEVGAGLSVEFYWLQTIILGGILVFVIIARKFDYWIITNNQIIHKEGVFQKGESYPVQRFRFKKEIPDLLEYLLLRAGSMTLIFSQDNIVHLNTVLNIKKKQKQLDELLSEVKVSVTQTQE